MAASPRTRTPAPAARLGAGLQAQPGRAAQARQEPAGDPRRAAGADRRGLRTGARGGSGAAQVVGAVPRQAEGRHVHAPDQAARRTRLAGGTAGDRRDLERLRPRRGRALHAPERPAALAGARSAAGGVRPAARRRAHLGRRLRRRDSQHHRLPRRRAGGRRAVRRPAGRRRGGGVLLRQPGVLEPAAKAQDHDRRLRPPLQRARDQLHRPGRRDPRGGGGLRRPRRRRALLGAPDRARPGRLRPQGRGGRGAARAARRLEGRPALPGLPGEGADEVHGRRLRPGRDPRGGRAAAGADASRDTSSRLPASSRTTSASIRNGRADCLTWACPSTSGSSPASG